MERIDLYQLHRIDPKVPLADQVGELLLRQQEGKVRHIGLSEVTVEQIEGARKIADIVSVQNLYNLAIPGTSRVAHLEEKAQAAQVALSDAQFRALGQGRLTT